MGGRLCLSATLNCANSGLGMNAVANCCKAISKSCGNCSAVSILIEVKKLPIRLVLEHYCSEPLPHKHGWVKVRCILHDERQASATFNETLNAYRCFACAPRSPIGSGTSGLLDGLDIVAIKEGCTDFTSANLRAQELFGEGVTGILSESEGKSRRRVFGESRPKRGQRNAFSPRVRGTRKGFTRP